MQISDTYIFNLIIELMSIKDEPEAIKELRRWINDKGLNVVFEYIVGMQTNLNNTERMIPYENIN